MVANIVKRKGIVKKGRYLKPERQYSVDVTDDQIRFTAPDGSITWIERNALEKVGGLTTADGPWEPDMFWILSSASTLCVVPWGASNEAGLLGVLQSLPDFRNDLIVESPMLSEGGRLTCWTESRLRWR
jgi:hypothetical protein